MRKRHRTSVLTVGLCWGLFGAAARAEQPGAADPGPVIDQVLKAYGGWERLSKVDAYRMQGQILTSHDKPAAPTYRILVRPERLKVVLEYPDRPEVRVLDGPRGWRAGADGKLLPVEGLLRDSMALQCARARIPWIFEERRHEVKLGEALPVGAVSYPCLDLPIGPGLALKAFLDPKTHRVARVVTTLINPLASTQFETRFTDFRDVEGLLFAFREENFAAGSHTASTVIERITLNPAATDDEFPR